VSEAETKHSTQKQYWIVFLLFISCFFSGALLLTTEPVQTSPLQSVAELDSLITETLADFDVDRNQIRIRNTTIDSSFTRKTYIVDVPSQFSKTTFHYNLHTTLAHYVMDTHGVVHFPDEDLHIHLLFENTVYRTIQLRTDPLLNLVPGE
jgi:uncharacterized protein (UPF0276 family)